MKKRRGAPKRKVSLQREKLFNKYRAKLIINNNLLPSSHNIYRKLASKLNVSSSQTVYLHVKRFFGIQTNQKSGDVDMFADDSEEDDHVFSLNIEHDDLIQQFIRSNAYLRGIRSYFRMIIWSCSNYNCDWHFDIVCSKQNQIICKGKCTNVDCTAQVSMNTDNDRRTLRIRLKNFNSNIEHTKKSLTTGAHKERIEKLLSKNTPYVTRSLFAAEMLEEGDEECSLVPSRNTLTKQKYRMKLSEKSAHLDPDPVLAVVKMKTDANTLRTIHNVAISPFYVMYSTPTQAALVKSEKKRSRIIISMDATGVSLRLSPLASMSVRTGKSKRCLLYVIFLHLNNERSVPMYQMISQDHSAIQISLMLKTCRAQNNHFKPHEIIMDHSAGLLLANVDSFTDFKSVHQYLDFCFEILHNKDSSGDSTYIRLDRSHVVHSIQTNFAVKKGINKVTATFYKRLLGYLIKQTDLEIIEHVIKQMFVVLNNQFLVTSDIINAVKSLESTAQQHKIDKDEINNHPVLADFDIDIDASVVYDKPKNKFNGWILEMAAKAHINTHNDSSNEGNIQILFMRIQN